MKNEAVMMRFYILFFALLGGCLAQRCDRGIYLSGKKGNVKLNSSGCDEPNWQLASPAGDDFTAFTVAATDRKVLEEIRLEFQLDYGVTRTVSPSPNQIFFARGSIQ